MSEHYHQATTGETGAEPGPRSRHGESRRTPPFAPDTRRCATSTDGRLPSRCSRADTAGDTSAQSSLRLNWERLHRFADISAVEAFLEELADRADGALVLELPRLPGARVESLEAEVAALREIVDRLRG